MAEYIKRAVAVTVCDKQYRECLRKSDFCGDTVAWNICADSASHRNARGNCVNMRRECPDCRREFWMQEVE